MPGRQHPRVPHEVAVTLESESNFYTGISDNISEGGIFVATLNPPPRGSEVGFELVLGPDERFLIYGVVTWVRDEGSSSEGAPAGCGIRWLTLEDGALESIRRFLASRATDFYED